MSESCPEILLVGCGKMGSALLGGWLDSGSIARVVVVEPSGLQKSDPRLIVVSDRAAIPGDCAPAIIVLAVKPQMMAAVAPAYRDLVAQGATVLSIAAGLTIHFFKTLFGASAAVIRTMPNTPAAIGRGVTVAIANGHVAPAMKALATQLLDAAGTVEWVTDEALIDPVTALSGGGPAYVFLLIEVLAEAGVKAGLPADLAMRLARATVAGSGELAWRSADPPDQLRRNVTSPNGTTQAALGVLMGEDRLQHLFDAALDAATRRSRELAG